MKKLINSIFYLIIQLLFSFMRKITYLNIQNRMTNKFNFLILNSDDSNIIFSITNIPLMRKVINFNKIATLTLNLNRSFFQVAQKSYYDVLGVSKTANPKQIRKQFLKKARQLHPDHNPSPQAQQKFKLLKQAYQTLKDPQKRYIYDSGISSEGINESNYTGGAQWRSTGKRYYENKWYDFKKSSYPDQRDEYYDEKFQEDEDAYQRKLPYRILGGVIFAGGLLSYLYMYNRKSVQDVENEHIKSLLEGPQQDKKTRRLRRYIEQRSKQNRVQQ